MNEHDERNDTHRHQLVKNGAQQAHLKHLRHKEPHNDENQDAHEDVERAALAHQPVNVVEHERHQQNIDEVFNSEF